jgi:hypothetical protein
MLLIDNYRHGRHRHSDERPFVCEWPLCDSRFDSKTCLFLSVNYRSIVYLGLRTNMD